MAKYSTAAAFPYLLFFFCLCCPGFLSAQITIPEIADPKDNDKEYIEYPKNNISLRLYGVNKYNLLHARPELGNTKALRYAPNAGWGFGIGAFYKTVGIWAGYSFPFFSKENQEKGRTRRVDLQLNIYKRKFGIDAYLQSYRGYYLENAKDVISVALPGYIVRPDLRTLALGINYIRVFNTKKFSLPSGFIQSEIQKKSAGSFVLKPSLSFFGIDADSSLFPQEYNASITPADNFVKGSFVALTISPGYIHNFVYKRFYLTLGLLPGVGVQYKHYITSDGNTNNRLGMTVGVMGRMGLGYSNKKFFAGLSAVTDVYNIPLTNMSMQYRVGHFRVFAGYRFNEKGIFKVKKKKKR